MSLRYNRAQIRYVLVYGRPFSPMPAWGVLGGGSLDDQQIEDLVSYLESIQISPKAAQAQVVTGLTLEKAAAVKARHPYKSDGEALFNLGYYSGFAGGAYSCGRCHTQGWSYGDKAPTARVPSAPTSRDGRPAVPRRGAGREPADRLRVPGLRAGQAVRRPRSGHRPHAGVLPEAGSTTPTPTPGEPAHVLKTDQGDPGSGMMTHDQVRQIVAYERGLG